jgi:hypothetical protein
MPARRRFLWPVLAGATLVILAAAIAGAEPARAVDPSPFLLGTGINAPNVTAEVTALKTSAVGIGLDVENYTPGATGIFGLAWAPDGVGTGIYGKTNSKGGGSAGVKGELNTGLPGAGSAGVIGTSFSTTDNGPGVYGQHLSSVGTGPGALGETNSAAAFSTGLQGNVLATSPGPGSAGIRGLNSATGASGVGIFGRQNGGGYGVYGATPAGWGVVGLHENKTGTQPGVLGDTNSSTPFAVGVQGKISGSPAGIGAAGVRGDVAGSGSTGVGVWGSHFGSGWGVYGYSANGFGVVGQSPTGFAGYFYGNVNVTGQVLHAASGSMIDDPLDPAHKTLSQASVESPDMKNMYDGIAMTDSKGFAVVRLPAYFQALNKDFRYQLTSLTGLQQVAVAKEISNNRFTIQSEKPRSRISWQVTGIRKDRFANAHRIEPVQAKTAADQGKYLNPQLYGQPQSKAIGAHGQLGAPPALPRAKAVSSR